MISDIARQEVKVLPYGTRYKGCGWSIGSQPAGDLSHNLVATGFVGQSLVLVEGFNFSVSITYTPCPRKKVPLIFAVTFTNIDGFS